MAMTFSLIHFRVTTDNLCEITEEAKVDAFLADYDDWAEKNKKAILTSFAALAARHPELKDLKITAEE